MKAHPIEERSNAVALSITDDEGRLLILWHDKYQFWTIPLGKIEPGEEVLTAARREAHEELGIQAANFELIEAIHKPPNIDDYADITIHLLRVASYEGEIANLEPAKHGCLKFVTPGEARNLTPLSFPTRELLRHIE